MSLIYSPQLLMPQGAYVPLNAAAARESCQGTGHTHGAPQMTVFVTGAGGFIGVHAVLMLRKHGHGEPSHSRCLTANWLMYLPA